MVLFKVCFYKKNLPQLLSSHSICIWCFSRHLFFAIYLMLLGVPPVSSALKVEITVETTVDASTRTRRTDIFWFYCLLLMQENTDEGNA